MSWIDIAAAISAQRHSGLPVVTASIDALDFLKPVRMGWVVNLVASVNFVSKTSMEVGVRVEAENPIEGVRYHTASAYLTFVALNDGKPTACPPIIPETEAEIRRHGAAIKRRDSRLALRNEIKSMES